MNEGTYKLVVGRQSDIPARLKNQMFAERKRIFVDQMGWDLSCTKYQEKDQFDRIDTIYLVVTVGGVHQASMRINRGGLSDTLSGVFAQKFEGYEGEYWEISRFISSAMTVTTPLYVLFIGAFSFFVQREVKKVIATVTPRMLRFYRMLGVDIEPVDRKAGRESENINVLIRTDVAAYFKFRNSMPPHEFNFSKSIDLKGVKEFDAKSESDQFPSEVNGADDDADFSTAE